MCIRWKCIGKPDPPGLDCRGSVLGQALQGYVLSGITQAYLDSLMMKQGEVLWGQLLDELDFTEHRVICPPRCHSFNLEPVVQVV